MMDLPDKFGGKEQALAVTSRYSIGYDDQTTGQTVRMKQNRRQGTSPKDNAAIIKYQRRNTASQSSAA